MPPCRVQPQPQNIFDSNALSVDVFLNECWNTIGFISVHQIAKVKHAIVNSEITVYKLNSPVFKENPNEELRGYFATINITKKDQWKDDDPDAVYNMVLPF